jgi:hypothetical protein
MKLRLGKLAARQDKRTLKFGDYGKKLPPAPDVADWYKTCGRLGVMLNDRWGDCVVAGYAHNIQTWTGADTGKPVVVPDKEILATYLKLTGGGDTGLVMLDSMKHWRKAGLAGHKIEAFVALDAKKPAQLKQAVWYFGGANVGIGVTDEDMAAFEAGKPWLRTSHEPGNHCVPIVGYDAEYVYSITWGKVQPMTWGYYRANCDESYCLLAKTDWTNEDAKSPNGFALDKLRRDIACL